MDEPFPRVCPFVSTLVAPDELSREPFPDGRPCGVTIHYTADRGLEKIRRSLVESKFCYHLIIGRQGQVEQHAWLDRRVWHAGRAMWNNMSPNSRFVAVALESWGELKVAKDGSYISWGGAKVGPAEVAARPNNIEEDSHCYWDAATPEQMASLNKICLWLVGLGINIANISGHDEAAIPFGRKVDPGGVLPMGMAEYRRFIAVDLEKIG